MRLWPRGVNLPSAVSSETADVGMSSSASHHEVSDGEVDALVSSAEVVLLTRTGCHLCQEAEPIVASACERHGSGLRVLEVDSDEGLRARFTDHVPVLFVRGALLDYWRVDEGRLHDALDGRAVAPPPAL